MRVLGCALVVVVLGSLLAAARPDPVPQARKGPDPARVKGMKAAVADIEAGKLRLRVPPLPAPAWYGAYLDRLKSECGVEAVHVDDFTGPAGAELDGYNGVMTLEIEHRFGRGVLKTLQEKAERGK